MFFKSKILLLSFALAMCWFRCASTNFPKAPDFSSNGIYYIPLPNVTLYDVHSGEYIDDSHFTSLILQLQNEAENIFKGKYCELISIDNYFLDLNANSFSGEETQNSITEERLEDILLASELNHLDSLGIDYLVYIKFKAKIGIASDESGINPIWGLRGYEIDFSGPYPRDPSAILISSEIFSLRNKIVVWENKIFKRKRIDSEDILYKLLYELFEPIKNGNAP